MMGHTTELEKHYERYTEEDFEMFSQYRKAIPYFTISNDERLKTEAIQKENQIKDLEYKNTELLQLKREVDKLKHGSDSRIKHYKGVIFDVNNPTFEMLIALFGTSMENAEWTDEQKRR